MLDSVLAARDRWLKPGGAMYPSHARMLLAPMRSSAGRKKEDEMADQREGRADFCANTRERFGVDMSALTSAFVEEQRQYFLQTSSWVDVQPSQLVGEPAVLCSFDLHSVTIEDIRRPKADFRLTLGDTGVSAGVDAFCGWFDVAFAGSEASPAETRVELDTSPDEQGATHWGQQAFYLHPPQPGREGDVIVGGFEMARKSENHRLLSVRLSFQHGRSGEGGSLQLGPAREEHYSIE
jgi:protein arginine N-methyltransferase 1